MPKAKAKWKCITFRKPINPIKMKPFLLSIILFLSLNLTGKEIIERVDSAYQYCVNHPTDTIALKNLNGALNKTYSNYPDTTHYYSLQQERLAKNANCLHLESRAIIMQGICMEMNGQLDSAISLYLAAGEVADKTSNLQLKASVYNNLGIGYSYKGLYESSIEYTLKALNIHESLNNLGGMSMMYNNLGLRYSEIQNNNEAIRYYHKAVKINQELGNEKKLGTNYNNLGRSYFLKQKNDSAHYYYSLGLKQCKKTDAKYYMSLSYIGLANVLIEDGKPDIALLYVDSGQTISEQIDDDFGIYHAIFTRGLVYSANGNHRKALEDYITYKTWINENSYGSVEQDAYSKIADSYYELGDYRNAYKYMRIFAYAKDSFASKQQDLALEQISLYKQSKLEKDKEILNQELEIKETRLNSEKSLRNTFVVIGVLLALLALGIGHRFLTERKIKRTLAEKNEIIQQEKDRSESLLLNILPEEVAEELKQKGESDAKEFDDVTVIFTDIIQFTKLAEKLSARELVDELNFCFKAFDNLVSTYSLEKIKTIGDSYMAASGLHLPRKAGAKEAVKAALAMQDFMVSRAQERNKAGKEAFVMRVGIHTGPVVAGIVGVKKFQYDIWGDTVNIASRMESSGVSGKVNISQSTFDLIQNEPDFTFESRGKIKAKGKGTLDMYFVNKKESHDDHVEA